MHQRLAAGEGPRWFLGTWKRGSSEVLRSPYLCRSWRCPTCRTHESHVLFARIREAQQGLDPCGWSFWVLTLDNARGRWPSHAAMFRELSAMTRKLLKRLRRLGERDGFHVGRKWVATVEAHRSGAPHVNLMVYSRGLAKRLESEELERRAAGLLGRNAVLLGGELLEHVTASGWGVQSTAERARGADVVASYMVKVAGQAERVVGELAKLSQLPTNAPCRFRRLRSGKGFLPQRRRNPDYSGTLLRRTTGPNGEPIVLPLHKVPACDRERVVALCYAEADRWQEELATGKPGAFVARVNTSSRAPPRGGTGLGCEH